MQENNNNNPFDAILKSNLEGFQVPYNAAHWQQMDGLLDAARFDQAIKEKVQYTHAPLQMAAWEKLSASMALVASRKKILYQAKCVEASLLALFFLVFAPLGLQYQEMGTKEPMASKILKNKEDKVKIQEKDNLKIQGTNNSSIQKKDLKIQDNNSNNNNNNTSSLPLKEVPTTTITSFENTEIVKETKAAIVNELKNTPSWSNAPMIAVLSPQLLSDAAKHDVPLFAFLYAAKRKHLHQLHTRLGIVGTSDKQTVMISEIQFFQKDRIFEQVKHAKSAGITLGIKRKNIELETGLEYSRFSYNSQTYFEQTASYIRQSLQPVRLELFRIPLVLRYDFHRSDRLSTFIGLGATMNLVSRANYDHSEYGESAFRATSTSNVTEKPSSYPDGLLKGGSFANNSYLSTNITIGVEYAVSPQYAFYLQPMYSWDVRQKGVGVTHDNLKTVSLRFGVKHSW
jgi:opacity protein-like surface antigen